MTITLYWWHFIALMFCLSLSSIAVGWFWSRHWGLEDFCARVYLAKLRQERPNSGINVVVDELSDRQAEALIRAANQASARKTRTRKARTVGRRIPKKNLRR